jgi:hypothetical protein
MVATRPALAPAQFTMRRARTGPRLVPAVKPPEGSASMPSSSTPRSRRAPWRRAARAKAGGGGERVGLALAGAEGAACHAVRDVGGEAAEVGAGEGLDGEAVGALDGGLALNVAHLGVGRGHQQAAGEGELQVRA